MQQVNRLEYEDLEDKTCLEHYLCKHRLLYVPTEKDTHFGKQKINQHEAERVVDLVAAFQDLYARHKKPFDTKTLGIITPYRAQIAQIRKVLNERDIDPDQFTIDTVERYQGGARDIILISLCTNSTGQLSSMISLSEEGVDRKLNVALTRARQHLVILGNQEILGSDPIYRDLIGAFPVVDLPSLLKP